MLLLHKLVSHKLVSHKLVSHKLVSQILVPGLIIVLTIFCIYILWKILMAKHEGLENKSSSSAAVVAGTQKLLAAAPSQQAITLSRSMNADKIVAAKAAARASAPASQPPPLLDSKHVQKFNQDVKDVYKVEDLHDQNIVISGGGKQSKYVPKSDSNKKTDDYILDAGTMYGPNKTILGQIWANEVN